MRDATTTLLDALAVLAVAAGVGGGMWALVGWWALCVAGALVLVFSAVSARLDRQPTYDEFVEQLADRHRRAAR